jgi:hypothetical protein
MDLSLFNIKNFLSDDEFWVFVGKFSGFARGPILSIAVVFYLSPELQGIWFTFFSLSMISVAAELGFTVLITQLLSHEFSRVKQKQGFIIGKKENVDKFFSLISYSLKIYLVIIPVALLLSIVSGFIIFSEESAEIRFLWVLFSIISCFSLINSLLQSIYMSMDYVSSVYKLRTVFNLTIALMALLLLFLTFELWSIIFSILFANLIIIFFLYREAPKFWAQLFRYRPKYKFAWSKYVLSLQGKYALSWISGYGSIHLLVPFVFSYYGPEMAGKLGLTISLLAGVTNLSLSWVDSLIPKLNILVATNKRNELNSVYTSSSIKGLVLFLFGSGTLILTVFYMSSYGFYDNRVLSTTVLGLFIISELGTFSVALVGKYLRTHKDEPLYPLSILHMLITLGILTVILPGGNFENVVYSLILLNCFISFPISIIIARRFLRNYYPT